ncbi:aspartyl-tRNA(Asn)/glutamyl-tRNA(Gln) amidotransferase subunit A [Planomicrobium sp. HSC-17F08]|nr:aspartyl-tRNA(Asn)/glutamyl-tRNA(Gln) amidotransferase subunit A [Planomicrobium sp. HSC-17F08]
MKKLLNQSITETAELYRKKEVSPVEVAKGVFEQQRRLEPELNAFITLMEEEAYRQAREAEKMFLNGDKVHLLTGIPYSAKDLFYTKGILTTCASNVLKDFKPDFSATVIEKLSRNGGVLIGKTNMLEFAYGIVHPDFRKTNNPWDTAKTSGGSSSGSAAAVASGIGYFSLGTDTGGSIRIPASYCGIVGLKPTRGLVSSHGVFPLSWSLDHAGPITRTVKDAAIVLEAIAGYDAKDSYSRAENIGQLSIGKFGAKQRKKRVGVLSEESLSGLKLDVKGVYSDTLKQIQSLGWELKEIDIADWERTEDIIMNVLLPEAAQIHQDWFGRQNDYAPLTYQQIALGMEHKAVDYLNGLRDLKRFTASVSKLFDEVDMLLTPTVAFEAPEEDPVIGSEELDEMQFTGPFNISGHPALTLNMGFAENGLPIGMQLIAPHFQDMELLESAYALEQTREMKFPPIVTR